MEEKALVKRNQRLEPSDHLQYKWVHIYICIYCIYIFYLCTDMYSMNFNKKLGPLGLEMFTLRFHSMPTTLSNSLSLSSCLGWAMFQSVSQPTTLVSEWRAWVIVPSSNSEIELAKDWAPNSRTPSPHGMHARGDETQAWSEHNIPKRHRPSPFQAAELPC